MSRSKKLKVLVLVHETLVPPENHRHLSVEERDEFRTESDVVASLEDQGHEVRVIGLYDELVLLRLAIDEFNPDVAVNLIEEFHELTVYDHNVVSYLELKRVPYTGCNPRGLVLGRDKALSKKILSYHRIKVPHFAVFKPGRKIVRPKRLAFPLIVKSLTEDASVGISQASVVNNDEKLRERVDFIHRNVKTPAIVEQYIDGREFYVGCLGRARIQVLPPWELYLDDLPSDSNRIATRRAKWDRKYQRRHGIKTGPARWLDATQVRRLNQLAKRIYKALGLSGYNRLDFRMDDEGNFWFLEANPNPELASDAEVALAAMSEGTSYDKLIARILREALRSLEV
jgi:D-alanine-D-alanine ligase